MSPSIIYLKCIRFFLYILQIYIYIYFNCIFIIFISISYALTKINICESNLSISLPLWNIKNKILKIQEKITKKCTKEIGVVRGQCRRDSWYYAGQGSRKRCNIASRLRVRGWNMLNVNLYDKGIIDFYLGGSVKGERENARVRGLALKWRY